MMIINVGVHGQVGAIDISSLASPEWSGNVPKLVLSRSLSNMAVSSSGDHSMHVCISFSAYARSLVGTSSMRFCGRGLSFEKDGELANVHCVKPENYREGSRRGSRA